MKKCLITVLLISAAISSAAQAEGKFKIEASPVLLFNTGKTDYTIQFVGLAIDQDGDTVLLGGRSQLEFPVDMTLTGFDIVAETKTSSGKTLTFNGSAIMSVTDPSTKMEDHDWWFDPLGTESFKWSWTESRTKTNYLLLKLEAAMSILQRPKVQLAAMAGFHYNRIEFDVMGYDGWQVRNDGLAHDVSKSSNVKVGYYKATYKLPQVGMRLNVIPSWQLSMGTQLALGRLMASDLDDHVLRGKTAEASTTGWAFLAQAKARLLLTQHGSVRPFFSGQFEYVKHSASGSQTQTWYR
ncbi:MAG: omptin family outer membrane protease, partial [candidate division Zixibacteria bacterium]|nr:omptin family outer membrane protease [candidate division Zixibacteria bacterium]